MAQWQKNGDGPPVNPPDDPPIIPDTGDSPLIIFMLALAALSALFVAIAGRKCHRL